jgi:hypothetical protein
MPTSTTWRIPRESGPEWVGPITVTVGGTPTLTGVKFAVLPNGSRPASFSSPDPDPEGSTGLGVLVQPTTSEAQLGIWAQVTVTGPNGTEEIVLDPSQVGLILRT